MGNLRSIIASRTGTSSQCRTALSNLPLNRCPIERIGCSWNRNDLLEMGLLFRRRNSANDQSLALAVLIRLPLVRISPPEFMYTNATTPPRNTARRIVLVKVSIKITPSPKELQQQ